MIAAKMLELGLSFELNLFQSGEHGMSVCNRVSSYGEKTRELINRNPNVAMWVPMCTNWMNNIFEIKKNEEKLDMKTMDKEMFDQQNAFGFGQANTAYAQYFVGNSYLNPLTIPDQCPVFLANVTFEPGCRNNWHIHRAESGGGQILICIAGEGWYQEEDKAAVCLTPGTVITIPANVKHWHGAKKDSWFSHIAVEVPGEETANEWLEVVSSEEYEKLD